LSRHQLIAGLMALNEAATFRFTPDWLRKQKTRRLRALLADAQRQRQAGSQPGLN